MKNYTPEDLTREEGGKWYFSEGLWCDEFGPFDTEKECREELAKCRKTPWQGAT